MRIERLASGDRDTVAAAAALFDTPPRAEAIERFLASDTHHLVMAFEDEGPVGFVTGVETTHPDKGTEMFLYELSVAPEHRRRGIGTALVAELGRLARERGCYAMWVATDTDNTAAIATYRSAGASEPEAVVVLDWTFEGSQET